MKMHNEPEKYSPRLSEQHSHAPALLNLRGTFFFPGQPQPFFPGKSPNRHMVPVNETFLIVHTDASVSLYHLPTQTPLWTIECPSFDFAFNNQQQLLVLAPGDPAMTLVIWDLHTGQIRSQLSYTQNGVPYSVNPNGLAFSPDGRVLAAGMDSGEGAVIVLWDMTDGRLLQTLETDEDDITTLAFHPNGNILACGSFNNTTIWIWSLLDGQLLSIWDYPLDAEEEDRCYHLAFAGDGSLLLAACGAAGLRVWDMALVCEVPGPGGDLSPVRITIAPDGQSFAVGDDGIATQIRKLRTWRLLHDFAGEYPSETFSSDGQLLATFNEHGSIYVWHVATETLLSTW
jgi:WD40 repeat protein